jgi:hypothetical protein
MFIFNFKKSVSVLLISAQFIGSQVLMTSASFAGDSSSQTPSQASFQTTSEVVMLSRVLSLQGEPLSEQDRQEELSQILSEYVSTASEDGIQGRLEDALVQLQLFTPSQAAKFVQDSQTAEQKTLNSETPDQLKQALANQIVQIGQLYPQGAEFSACTALLRTGATSVALGFAGLFAGLFVSAVQTCRPGTQAPPRSSALYTAGSARCMAPTVAAHPDLGAGIYVGSGVALIVGFLLLFHSDKYCTD